MRQALLAVTNQTDFLTTLAGDASNCELCPSFFTCGTPMANDAGSEALTGERDFGEAKNLIAEAGYNGEKIVVLDAVDQPTVHSQSLVLTELLKKLGLNVDLEAMDWGTLSSAARRKIRSTKVAGACSQPPGEAPICSTRFNNCRCGRTVPAPISVGRRTPRSRP
jgi:ABC-type transport system substrate-binding protein